MSKSAQLKKLKSDVEGDKSLPLKEGATQLVFGEGNPDTDIYFLGEAPGYWEDQKGRPFVGQAGKLLDELIESIGLARGETYISNVVRYRPPENRDPLPEEIEAFAPYVDKEIEIIDPKLIITLGRFSMAKFLGPYERISKVHGKLVVVKWKDKNTAVIPMYHPAAALRSAEVMRQIREDFKKIPEVLQQIRSQEEGSYQNNRSPKQLSLI